MVLGEPEKDRFERWKVRLRDLARLPIIVFVIFTSALSASPDMFLAQGGDHFDRIH